MHWLLLFVIGFIHGTTLAADPAPRLTAPDSPTIGWSGPALRLQTSDLFEPTVQGELLLTADPEVEPNGAPADPGGAAMALDHPTGGDMAAAFG